MKRKHILFAIGLVTMCTICPTVSSYGAEITSSNLSESVSEVVTETSGETEDTSNSSEETQQEILTEMQEVAKPQPEEAEDPNLETPLDIPDIPETEVLDETPSKQPESGEKVEEEVGDEEQSEPPAPIYEGKWLKNQKGWWWKNPDGTYPVSQWKQIEGIWYYFSPSGYMTTGWQQVHGTWYYMNASGAMVTGWQFIHGSWYYMNPSGAMTTGWQQIHGTWYHLNTSGVMDTGWIKSGNTWYYLAPSGAMQTGWVKSGNTWYYMNASGAMATGWQFVDHTWYYLSSSGAMKTGWLQLGSSWYYLNASGAMQTGWLHTGNQWYYLTESGSMINSCWKEIDKKWYYFHGNGSMASNTWVGNYYVDSSGAWVQDAKAPQYVWPCPGYPIVTSDFGYRGSPTAGASSYHKGIDIGAPHGAQIVSICNGNILAYGYNSSMGNYVKVQHGNGLTSVYMHMSRIANLSTGQSVSAGTVIGYVGSTGISTGAHLHLGVLKNNTYVSPLNYLKRP